MRVEAPNRPLEKTYFEVNKIFSRQLTGVELPIQESLLVRSDVALSATVFKNPRVVELKIPPKHPETAKTETVVPSPPAPEPELKQLHPAKEVEGQLFVFDVSLYRNLYNEYLKAPGGGVEMAKRNVLLAATKDGTSLVQENISALKDEKGKLIVDDPLVQAKMQQTPTIHSFLQVTNLKTNQEVITSPEYIGLGKSITSALTGWRRGNDRAVVGEVENLAITLPDLEDGTEYTLLWASPKAEKWENEWIKKYNGEYGYQYVGHLTGEAGARELIIDSIKVDAKTETFSNFISGLNGEQYMASFGDRPEEIERPFLDNLMRTVTVVKGNISGREVISGLYKSKKEVESSDRMFGILEDTMHFIQDPSLRERIEAEVAAPVAKWLVDQIVEGVEDCKIQQEIRDKYIAEVKAFVKRIQEEEKVVKIPLRQLNNLPEHRVNSDTISVDKMFLLEDLARRTQTAGGFCGDWGNSSSSGLFDNPLADLANYTGISGMRSSVFARGGILGSEAGRCSGCKLELCDGRCPNCENKHKRAA